jgi:hypothetical protein
MARAGSFSQQVGSFARNSKAELQRKRKGITIGLMNAVVLDTPVLSGRLRANWNLSEGEPDKSTSEEVDKTGTITCEKIVTGVNATDGRKPVFLTNSLPYAFRIEFEGWSHTKAPEGMVRKNVARISSLVAEHIK